MNRQDMQQYMISNKDIIVNPWKADKVDASFPAINMSPSEKVRIEKVPMKKYDNNPVLNKNQTDISESIYEDVKVLHTIRSDENNAVKDNIFTGKDETSFPREEKNEIIYWKITTKEVAKFKPCTEICIGRSKLSDNEVV